MKKEDIPQDPSALRDMGKEICYALDDNGEYTTVKSTGWEVKATALDVAWQDIEKKTAEAKQKVLNGEASPLLYFMHLRIMNVTILSAYTGFWKWTIKQHLRPSVFKALSEKKLAKYAALFEVTIEELKTMKAA